MTRDMLKSILLLCQTCTTKTLLLIIVWQNRVPDYCKAVWGSGYYEIRSSVALPDDVPQDQGALQKRRSVSANISRHRSLIAGPIGAITIAADHDRIDRSDQSLLQCRLQEGRWITGFWSQFVVACYCIRGSMVKETCR